MAAAGRPARDLRADVCRGLALWMIMVNHMPGNGLTAVTIKNFAFADATEAFVLLAGYAAAFAYAGQADRQGLPFALAAVLRRIGVLYIAHIFLLVLFTAQVGESARALDRAFYLDELALDPFAEDPYRTLSSGAAAALPAALPGHPAPLCRAVGHAGADAAAPAPCLGAARAFSRDLDLGTLGRRQLPRLGSEGWFFNPLGWQLIFVIGFLIGQAVRGKPGPKLPRRNGWLTAFALAMVAGGFVWQLSWQLRPEWGDAVSGPVAALLVQVDKTTLHPARLSSILAMAYLVGHYLPREWPPLRGPWLRPFLLMGQHSLPVFCAGILLSFLGRLVLEAQDGWAMQAAVNLGGFALLVAVGEVAAWYRRQERATIALPRPAGQR